MASKGYELFFTDPNKHETMKCKVCGTFCDVKRGIIGATSFAESVSGSSHLHDEFICPNKGEKWHVQALELIKEIEKCHSPTLVRLMKGDLERLINEREATI